MNNRNKLFENYLSDHFGRIANPDHYRRSKISYVEHNYKKYLPKHRDARILDIGPGFGEVMEWLVREQHYTNVQAIDLSAEIVAFCNMRLPNSTLLVENTDEFLVENLGKYDCIFMLHVLEHVPKQEVIPLLRNIRNALTPSGCLIVEVPNMANPFIGLYTRYADFTHESGFTDPSLEFVLRSADFSRIDVFGLKLPMNRFSRVLQFLIQTPLIGILTLIYRIYGLRPKALSSSVCAVAFR